MVPLNGAECILEVKAGYDVVRVFLPLLGGAYPELSLLQMEIQIRPGLGKGGLGS